MKCPTATVFEDYLTGTLAPEETRAFEAHISECATCRQTLEVERRFDALLRSPSLLKAPEGFREKVLSRLDPLEKPNRLPDWLTALALGLLISFAGLMVGKWGDPLIRGVREKISGIDIHLNIFKPLENLLPSVQGNWISQLTAGSHIMILNIAVAGVILCWGLWQKVKALR
jgi:hypothetical protein